MGTRINIYSVTLVRESAKVYDLDRTIRSPRDAYDVIQDVLELSTKTKENLVMMSLNTKNQVIGLHTIHVGTVNASLVHPRDVLQQAILNNATSFMMFHNHPSGDVRPSNEDIEVTNRMVEAGKIIGIEMLDHIIVGERTYLSMSEKGYIEKN